jgi:hypothetical protein
MGRTCHITNNKHNQVAHVLKIAVQLDSGVKIQQELYFFLHYIHDTVT